MTHRFRGGSRALLLACLASPVAGQITSRVSVDSSGAQGNSESIYFARISADGRYVAFYSDASNLVSGDTNGWSDSFIRDRFTGTTERVSVASGGAQGDHGSWGTSISDDGRFVTFESFATNLVSGDTNASWDVFFRARVADTTDRVSVGVGGAQGNGDSKFPRLSADGRFVLFTSFATNLVSGDTNGFSDAFLFDRVAGTTERVSVGIGGAQGNGHSKYPKCSADGRFVLFISLASNLVSGDTNGNWDVFLRDRQAGTTERVNVGPGGVQANGGCDGVEISADARYVAFDSDATNLVPGGTSGGANTYVRDRVAGTTEIVSVDSGGVPSIGASSLPGITADGSRVVFQSNATNLVSGDTNGTWDIFVRDRLAGTTERLSVSSSGVQGNGNSWQPCISADGRYVSFTSAATDLVPRDTNGTRDVFLHDPLGGPSFVSLCQPGIAGVIACPCSNPSGGFGQGCDNSATTGGALLSATGGTFLSSDSLVFVSMGERPMALSMVIQGNALIPSGTSFGQGVRCAGGTLKRLYTRQASGGMVTVPDFSGGDPQVSVRSAALGDTITAGQSRWYLVYYRDPIVLGGCPATSNFNSTQTGQVTWSP